MRAKARPFYYWRSRVNDVDTEPCENNTEDISSVPRSFSCMY